MRKRIFCGLLAMLVCCFAGTSANSYFNTPRESGTVSLRPTETHQTMEGFGASLAWWSQLAGGWNKTAPQERLETREQIARLLFSPEEGIGLTSVRYNLGAGSTQNLVGISDPYRRTESFLRKDGTYDWSADANARWILQKAVDWGVKQVTLFVNSPPVSMTKNGKSYSGKGDAANLAPERYEDFADYVCTVAEHFLQQGIPVTEISPLNEPQRKWNGEQEGCHYSPEETAALLRTFVKRIGQRPALDPVKIAAFESGSWRKKDNTAYLNALAKDAELASYFTALDFHSYHSARGDKKAFSRLQKKYGIRQLRMSEWCQLENGKDTGIDSALVLANEILDDLNLLHVTRWQYWIACSMYDYHDGLLYLDEDTQTYTTTKRLWAMGNFSKFIRPGSQQISCDVTGLRNIKAAGFQQDGKITLVLANSDAYPEEFKIKFTDHSSGFKTVTAYETSKESDLKKLWSRSFQADEPVVLSAKSVTTLVLEP